MNTKIVFAADLHGSVDQYSKLKDFVKKNKVDVLLLGGDLFPKDGGLWKPGHKTRNIESQKKFILTFFLPFLKELNQVCKTYFIFGNDDFASNITLFDDLPSNAGLINNKKVDLASGYFVYGYPFVSATPFLQKDWEKWDLNNQDIYHKQYVPKGYTSKNDQHFEVDLNSPNQKKQSLELDLEKIAEDKDLEKTIFVMHEPPFDTNLDQTSLDNPYRVDNQVHIGSKAIRNFVENYQPYLTLHGHIHETVDQSSQFINKFSNTVSATAGNDFKSNTLSILLIEQENINNIKRVQIN